MGLIFLTLMSVSLLEAHSRRETAQVRQTAGASTIVTDSAIARILVELAKPENSGLLTRNFDPINPETRRNYLGRDSIVNSGDEEAIAVDEWSGFNPSTQSCTQADGIVAPTLTQAANRSGQMGQKGRYQLLAYRYDENSNTGTVLVAGDYDNIQSHVQISISVEQDWSNFPGVGIIRPSGDPQAGAIALRGRQILGSKANVYFPASTSANPTISGSSLPTDAERNQYLNAIWSSVNDGSVVDSVQGKLVACDLQIQPLPGIEAGETPVRLTEIATSQTLTGNPGRITYYQIDRINLSGTDILELDTSLGPIHIEFTNPVNDDEEIILLTDDAQILHRRQDGQPSRVGDARLMNRSSPHPVTLRDRTCIQNVFLYSHTDELRLMTSGAGCPGGLNTNFEGVVWVEGVFSSKNQPANRNVNDYGRINNPSYDTEAPPNPTTNAGIAVPDDISSLIDLVEYTQMPQVYRYGQILNWQPVRL
ncbi:MAG: hypothetical protein HC810_04965 [Acaryochloridaceae cyanobacterium RL_2_7]|nr:hypothetical protein [Acaryochloridaceae cyanobacterium RL_2_7]